MTNPRMDIAKLIMQERMQEAQQARLANEARKSRPNRKDKWQTRDHGRFENLALADSRH